MSKYYKSIIFILILGMGLALLFKVVDKWDASPWNTGEGEYVFQNRHEYIYKRMGKYIYRGEKLGKSWKWDIAASAYVERGDSLAPVIYLLVVDTLEIKDLRPGQ